MDDLIRQTKNYKVVSADMPQLIECMICSRLTRTEWKSKKKSLKSLWACKTHTEKEVIKKSRQFKKQPIYNVCQLIGMRD